MLTTPIDAHLPLVIALVLACAWAARGTGFTGIIQCAVPLLIAAMMTIADDRTRLMAYGVIVAAAFGVAVLAWERARLARIFTPSQNKQWAGRPRSKVRTRNPA